MTSKTSSFEGWKHALNMTPPPALSPINAAIAKGVAPAFGGLAGKSMETWMDRFLPSSSGGKIASSALPETHSSPLKIGHPKRKLVFQPSIFRCYVSFRESNYLSLISN